MLYLRSFNRFILTSLALLGLSIPSAYAATVSIVNAGFEHPAAGSVSVVPHGWDLYDPDLIAGPGTESTGYYNPGEVNDADDFYGVNVPAPEGHNAAWIQLYTGFGSSSVGIEQTLASILMPNSQYILSVEIGNLKTTTSPRSGNFFDMTGFPGYTIQLLAGGNVIADAAEVGSTDPADAGITEGFFSLVSLSLTTGATDAYLYERLGIRLINNNDIDLSGLNRWSAEVDFDDVQLSVNPVPVPAAIWLFGTALIGLVGFGKRRKSA